MDSPSPRREARRAGWLLAITLWSAFLGAVLCMLVEFALPPATGDLASLSLRFLAGWAALALSIALALALARPLFARD